MHRLLLLPLILFLPACTALPSNPSFSVTTSDAERALDEMRESRKPLRRPLVIIGGFMDPNLSPPFFRWRLDRVINDDRMVLVAPGFCRSFAECRKLVIDAVDHAFPSNDPNFTTEVDVIGASLGGLVARYAAAPAAVGEPPRRLKVARLFTIASPHAGASLAIRMGLTQFHFDIRPGSAFLNALARHDSQAGYELHPYTRLNDDIVGERFAAPPGQTPHWVANPHFQLSHAGAMADSRIFSDIARRLRDETPFTSTPRAPLP